ncbi:MAG: transglycosylase SLT domain-containing protein [Bacteroidetes bacterium]|nr:transglycosylase SLT domain-containing protein [Bacteroidota bacterium]
MENLNLKISNQSKHITHTPEIASKYSTEEKEKIAGASKDFESLLTSMMIKSMTQTTQGLFGSEGFGGDYFDTLLEGQIASMMSKGKGLGISEQVYRKITGEELNNLKIEKIDSNPFKNSPLKINKTSPVSGNLKPSLGSVNRLEKYNDIISSASKKYGIGENLIKSVILTESAANPTAVSKANAKGLMQLMDSTAQDMGVNNCFNPVENIHGGAKYLAKMIRQYNGNLELALAAYNAGPGNVAKYDGIPPFKETKNYINRVINYLNYLDG